MTCTPSPRRRKRRGASAVELAIILPLVLLLLVGSIEIGRAVIVQHTLVEAARAGCRVYAVTQETTEQDVRNMVDSVMSQAGLTDYDITFDPRPTKAPAHMDPMTVTVSLAYSDVALLPPWFLNGDLQGTCIMPADTGAIYGDGTDP